nr:MAG TPA: Rz lysis protein [Caudoviricetes sp.]
MKQKLIIGIACLLVGLIAGWLANGWRLNTKIEATAAEHAQALLRAEQEARAKEQAWQAAQNELQAKYEQEKKDAESKIADLRRRVQSGAVRLSVATRSCAVSSNSGTATGETRAELDAQTADDLVAIAADGDDAIRELNLCIDQYNAIR